MDVLESVIDILIDYLGTSAQRNDCSSNLLHHLMFFLVDFP